MSWAEDAGIDDWGAFDGLPNEEIEENWQNGFHVDREGNEYQLSEMTTDHLSNTINYFKHLDSTPLKEELRKRKIICS